MKKLLAFLISGALALSMVACGGSEPAPAPEGGEASGGTVSIGAVLPLTGSSTGEYLKAAMEVAEDIINNSHDLDWDLAKNEGILGGQKIEIKFADHQASAEVATTEAANLLDAGVVAITGAYNSGCSASVATQALEYGVPMVCGSSSSASLTDGTTYSFGSIFNRVAANDAQESDEFFEYLTYLNDTYDAGIKKVAIAWINNSYGIHADEMFQKYAAEYGFEVVGSVSYESTSTSFDTEAAQIKATGADVVFQASYIGDLTLFAQAYSSIEFFPKAIICYCGGFQDASFAKVATDLGVNSYAGGQACTAELADKLPVFSYVNDLYKAKTGQDIDGPALEEFASIIIAAQAIEAAGSADPEAINAALKANEFAAPYLITQKVKFDEYGQNIVMPAVVTQLIDGKYEVVYPINEFTTSDPVLE
ncbi:MAG: hypothetical protein E7488_04180 [Ruminococcaceae bacterium]|nr:hypothetical protein [Oscillospiraceae bacterium]